MRWKRKRVERKWCDRVLKRESEMREKNEERECDVRENVRLERK